MKFLLVFGILIIQFIISTIIGMQVNETTNFDVQTHLQTIIIAVSIIYAIYAGIFTLIDNYNPQSKKFITIFMILVSCIFSGYSILFYTHKIDWYSVNNGLKELTLFEKLLHSDAFSLGMIFSTLILYFGIVFFKKRKSS